MNCIREDLKKREHFPSFSKADNIGEAVMFFLSTKSFLFAKIIELNKFEKDFEKKNALKKNIILHIRANTEMLVCVPICNEHQVYHM